MSDDIRTALDRTLLLMRDDLRDDVADLQLIDALTRTTVVFSADGSALASHGAQSAFVTAVLLACRSGHRVFVDAPDVPLVGAQPPLPSGRLVTSLLEVGRDLLPGMEIRPGVPAHADVAVSFGSTRALRASQHIFPAASNWAGAIHAGPKPGLLWPRWPLGAMAAGCLAAGEVFKYAMRTLRAHARDQRLFDRKFAVAVDVAVELATDDTQVCAALGSLELVSVGAISNAAMFALSRIPDVHADLRALDAEALDLTNLNRYALALRSDVDTRKVDILASRAPRGLRVTPVGLRLDERSAEALRPTAERVLVGVDHIPTRWVAQQLGQSWLAIGATSHWDAMVSVHAPGLACARCAHPIDDPGEGPIPTVAFVSFWGGLLLASELLRAASGLPDVRQRQHAYLTALRPECVWRGPVAPRPQCPICGGWGIQAASAGANAHDTPLI